MRGIEFEVIYFDSDLIEYQVTCSNGSFCGAAKMYLAHDDLLNAADTLKGFPSHNEDFRTIRLGTLDANSAGSGIHMFFACVDSAGHAVVFVQLGDDGRQAW